MVDFQEALALLGGKEVTAYLTTSRQITGKLVEVCEDFIIIKSPIRKEGLEPNLKKYYYENYIPLNKINFLDEKIFIEVKNDNHEIPSS